MLAALKGVALPRPRYATVVEALECAGPHDGGLVLVDRHEGETSFSWAQIHEDAQHFAGGLQQLGVRPGDRVAIILPTGTDFLTAFFGAQLCGAVPVPLYPPVRLGRLAEYHASTARMLRACSARVLLVDARVRKLLGQATRLSKPELGCLTVDSVKRAPMRPVAVTPGMLGVIQFSSGSTVDPKPVALSHGNLVDQLSALQALLPMDAGQRPVGVSWLPLYHDMGLIGALLSAVYFPGTLVLLSPEDFLVEPALWLRALSRHRANIAPAPNFAYGLCVKRVADAEMEGVDLSSWRFALNGAEHVSVSQVRRFGERFAKWGFKPEALMPVYGLSEASLAVTFAPRDTPRRTVSVCSETMAGEGVIRDGTRELASVGVPVPGAEVEVRGAAGEVLAPRQVGRVVVKSPSVMQGYFERPALTADAIKDGWLDTGDLGFVDGGELYLCGRAKDLVILRGANHPPQEFEECLESVSGVRTGCAVAIGVVPPGEEQEGLVLLVELAAGADSRLLEAQVRATIAEATGIRPHSVVVLSPGTLPRTSSGKLRRAEAQKQYLAGTLAPPRKVNALTVASEVAKSTVSFMRARFDA